MDAVDKYRCFWELGRIGEKDATSWSYHLPDALGIVRQIVDASDPVEVNCKRRVCAIRVNNAFQDDLDRKQSSRDI